MSERKERQTAPEGVSKVAARRALEFATRAFGVAHVDVDASSLRKAMKRDLGNFIGTKQVELSDDLMTELAEEAQFAIGKAVVAFNFAHEDFRTSRGHLAARLEQFREQLEHLVWALGSVDEILEPTVGVKDKIDYEVLRLVASFAPDADASPKAPLNRMQSAKALIEPIFEDARVAFKAIEALVAGGRPELVEYEYVVELALLIAGRLGLDPTTGGDRSDNPYSTPFTRLVYECLESLLPEDLRAARSPSLAACAKRIERSAAWRRHRGLD